MKKLILLIIAFWCQGTISYSQTLSGNCTDNFSGTISYNPTTDNYLTSNFSNTFQGNLTASGDYKIFPATGNSCSTLKKVVIVVEGFDMANEFTVDDDYDFFNPYYNTAADNMRVAGYDIIVLNFTESKDYIERNAMLLVELIKRVNNSKVTEDEITVIGASMGGLVARYALSYMEANNIDHHTRLFISFDSPNKGANIPMGCQLMLLDIHNNPISGVATLDLWDGLVCPAASQLLRHHLTSGTVPPTLNTNMTKFYTKLRGLNGCMGYPKNCKNMAVTLGATDGTGQIDNANLPMISGAIAVQYLFQFGPNNANGQGGWITTYPTSPPLPANSVGDIVYNAGDFFNTLHQVQPALPLDIAPGGYSTIFGDFADAFSGFTLGSTSVTRDCDNATFIPTISSLDYNETDLFYNIASDVSSNTALGKMPFDDFKSDNVNSEHINSVSSSILNWVSGKITGNVGSVCNDFNLTINGITYTSNYYTKAQNNVEIKNETFGSYIFDVFAGNQIEIKDETEITAGAEFRAYIKSCSAPKSCSFSSAGLRTMQPAKVNSLEFTAESYPAYYASATSTDAFKKLHEKSEVFPNPTSDVLNVNLFAKPGTYSLIIEDVTGKTLLRQDAQPNQGAVIAKLSLQNFTNGIYILKISDPKGGIIRTEKVILNK